MPNVPLPANIYAGGAAKIDSNTFAHYYINTLQRRQAQEDALARYFGEMGSKLTPAGMHTNDIDTMVQKKNQWQNYIMQHRQEYAHPSLDNGKSYGEATQLYNDMLAHIQKSKDKVRNIMTMKPIIDDPKKRALLTKDTQEHLRRAELPVTDAEYAPIDYNDINYNPEPFGVNKELQLKNILRDIKPAMLPTGNPITLPNGRQRQNYSANWDDKSLGDVQSLGQSLLSDPGWQDMVDKNMHNGQRYQQMNDLYKNVYGRPILTPQDMSTAEVLSRHPNPVSDTKEYSVPSTTAEKMKLQENASNLSLRNQKKMVDYRNTKKQTASANMDAVAEKEVTDLFTAAQSNPTFSNIDNSGEMAAKFRPEVLKEFPYFDNKLHKTLYPNEGRFTKEGNFRAIFRDANGDIAPISKEYPRSELVKAVRKHTKASGVSTTTQTQSASISSPISEKEAESEAQKLIERYK